jgi:hypothetical protein
MFGSPKCGHCNGVVTKLQTIDPDGSNYKQNAICCSSCNSILGVVGYYDAGVLLNNQEKRISAMISQIGEVTQMVRDLQQEIEKLKRAQK